MYLLTGISDFIAYDLYKLKIGLPIGIVLLILVYLYTKFIRK